MPPSLRPQLLKRWWLCAVAAGHMMQPVPGQMHPPMQMVPANYMMQQSPGASGQYMQGLVYSQAPNGQVYMQQPHYQDR